MLVGFVATHHQWLLTEAGQQELEYLLEKAHLKGCNQEKLAKLAGISRQTVGKFLPSSPGKSPQPVQKNTLKRTFNALNEKIKSEYFQCKEAEYRRTKQQSIHESPKHYKQRIKDLIEKELDKILRLFDEDYHCYQCQSTEAKSTESITEKTFRFQEVNSFSNPEASSSPENQESAFSINPEKVADLLWTLNYRSQSGEDRNKEEKFQDEIEMLHRQRISAFLVQAKDRSTQRWLLKRLARQIPNYQNARKIHIKASRDMQHDFNKFWIEFARELKTEENPRSIIEALHEHSQSKPVLILISHVVKYRLSEQIIHDFWFQLLSKIKANQTISIGTGLILFLSEVSEEIDSNNIGFSDESIICLSPLEGISTRDTEAWLFRYAHNELKNIIGQKSLNLILEEVQSWGQDPQDVINGICDFCRLKEDIAEIERFWKWER